MTPATTLPPAMARNALVLLAEDDVEMRRLLEQSLRCDGYDLVAAGSGLQLFDELRRLRAQGRQPDLVVSDVRMPGLSGIQLLGRIRDWGWRMPVVLISAFVDEDTRHEAYLLGGDVLFSKPFELDDLRTAVASLLETETTDDHDGWASVRPRAAAS